MVVEIMLPAAPDDGPAVVAAEPRLHGRLSVPAAALKAVVEQIDRAASGRGGSGTVATLLERILVKLVERLPDRQVGKDQLLITLNVKRSSGVA